MTGKIVHEDEFRYMVSAGCIPLIKSIIEKYEKDDDPYLYATMCDIGKVVENYQSFFQTGSYFKGIGGEQG